MSEEKEEEKSNFVYFRDRANELGREDAYEITDPSKPFNGYKNPYKVSDLAIWQHIIANQ
ncbi:hypothetical protein MNBD_GAMMA12-2524 [hydrothermal vent metagenome]|uniref:Uncharacterized protein n=1 Tax=hydrothermal vent metagenome TaxID=652676 RepID=A0A3B0YDB2_9ZZZZ